VKEWYGWHFPELAKIINDNLLYARVVRLLKQRKNIAKVDLTDILEENEAKLVTKAAAISMGTDVADDDVANMVDLADQVIEINQYREELGEYIKNRMFAIAPNLTVLVGELVGARLIAHAGSLLNLAKSASSTVQIMGAEKALFRALKANAPTPKYGVIFHASIVGQVQAKNKGKISRILANKASLGSRVDALGDETTSNIGAESLQKITKTLMAMEGKSLVPPTSKPTTIHEISRGKNFSSPVTNHTGFGRLEEDYNEDMEMVVTGKTEVKKEKDKKRKSRDNSGSGESSKRHKTSK